MRWTLSAAVLILSIAFSSAMPMIPVKLATTPIAAKAAKALGTRRSIRLEIPAVFTYQLYTDDRSLNYRTKLGLDAISKGL